jgi:hypothetical protein
MTRLFGRFFPREYFRSVFDVDYGRLLDGGFRGLIFDIDNTLAVFDESEPSQRVTELLERLIGMGFKVCLLSNNSKDRVDGFNRTLRLKTVHRAGKPSRKGIRRAAALLGLSPRRTVLIGDQMFTDVWGGNRAGVYTVLVRPIAGRDEWTVRLKRVPERFVFKLYQKHRGNINV